MSDGLRTADGGLRTAFYFDLGSPYSWLAAERVNLVMPSPPVWQPVLLGGLFKIHDRRSWSLTEDRESGMREVERRAAEYGLPPVRWPDPWPGNMLAAMRAATYAAQIGKTASFALAAFRQAFNAGKDLSDPNNVVIAAAACELHPRAVLNAIESDTIKSALRSATDEAAELGVFGVPTLAVDGVVFWGDDQLEAAAAAAKAEAASG